jgi:hypothetical protein
VYDDNTIYGTVTGDVQEGVTVKVYSFNCGSDILVGEPVTNSEGNYSLHVIENGRYFVLPDVSGYSVKGHLVDIPHPVVQPNDFTAIED